MSASEEIAQQYANAIAGNSKEMKLESFGYFLDNYVIQGAAVSLDTNNPRRFVISEGIISFGDGLYRVYSDTVTLSSSGTYFVDFTVANGYVVNTVHPSVDYLPLWQINTDGTGNITGTVDLRGTMGFVRFRSEIQGIITDDLIVDEEHITPGAVGTTRIANLAVTEPKLADDSVSARTIQDNAVRNFHIIDDAVSSRNVQDRAITADLLADGSVLNRTLAPEVEARIGNSEDRLDDQDSRIDTILQGNSETKDPELTDIQYPDPSYTPARPIDVAGDMVRDMQQQFTAQLAETTNAIGISVDKFPIIVPEANDTGRLQRAHDYVKNNNKGNLILPPAVYNISDSFLWDVAKVSVIAYGATINATGITDLNKAAIRTISSETGEPYNQATTILEGLKIVGSGRNGCKGLWLDGAADGNKGASHISIRNCKIASFNQGVIWGYNAYAANFIGCDITDCSEAVICPGGYGNYGERMTFIGCTIFNNLKSVVMQNGSGSFHFIGCSLDYVDESVVVITSGRVFFDSCHIENNAAAFDATKRPFVISGNGSTLVIKGGWFLFTYAPSNMDYIFNINSDVGSKGGVDIDGTFMNNCRTTTGYLATGGGRITVQNIKSYAVDENAPLVSDSATLLYDGSFEQTSIKDTMWITEDTGGAVTVRKQSGNNLVLSTSTDYARTGSRSLKVTKSFGEGSSSSFTIMIPISKFITPGFRLYYKKPGAETGDVIMSYGFAKMGYDDNVSYDSLSIGSQTVNFTSAAVDWTAFNNGTDRQKSPGWATHLYIAFNLIGFVGPGSIYIDDLVVTEM